MKISTEQKEFLTAMLGVRRAREIEKEGERQLFAGPVEWMGLDPETTVEIEVSGAQVARLQHELANELRRVEGLQVEEYVRKAFDIPQLVYLAGAVGAILTGLDVLLRWYSAKRRKGEAISLTIRTKRAGELNLSAHSLKDARELLAGLEKLLKRPPPSAKK